MTILAADAHLIEPALDLESDRSEVAKAGSGPRFRLGLKARLGAATFLAAFLVSVLGGVIAPSIASAGTNGQQIDIGTYHSYSVQICGNNQNNNYVCAYWNTPSYWTAASGWYWKGTVKMTFCYGYNLTGCYAQRSVWVPPSQSGDWIWVQYN